MKYFLIFLTLIEMFLMSSSLPVLTYPDLMSHHPDIDDLYIVEDLASNILARIESEETQDARKTIPSTLFLQKLISSSQLYQEYKPQATKRGGKMFNKRNR